MDDFQELIDGIHERGMKLVMDLVVNHTSDQHNWFKESRKGKDNPYRDYYIWRDGKDGKEPNNWGSYFSGAAWKYDDESGQYYLHLFAPEQPDLNWENPQVRHSVYDMMNWWAAKGVDGFRMDVINLISKPDGLPDAKKSGDEKYANVEPLVSNGHRIHEFLQEMNKNVMSKHKMVTVGETPGATPKDAEKYASLDNKELNMIFQFEHMGLDSNPNPALGKWDDRKTSLKDLRANLTKWQEKLYGKAWNSLYWNNHDMARLATRIAKNNTQARSLAMLMYLQCGIPIIYYGEELGMRNLQFENVNDFQDDTVKEFVKSAEKAGKTTKEALLMASKTHKLPARGPMPWNNERNNGFTDKEPWIQGKKLDEANVADEIADDSSMFNFYKKLISLKKEQLFQEGNYYLWPTSNGSYVYERNLKDKKALIAVSLSQEPIELEVGKEFSSERLAAGEYDLTAGKLRLEPYAGVVLEN